MAKTKGQLLSLRAYGTLGNVLTYQGRKGFRHTHRKATPRNPRSAAQVADRVLWANAVAAWRKLTTAQKNYYEDLSEQYGNIPGFNVFMKLEKNYAGYWTRFGEAKFGATKKFGGPRT